jgi:universal stress protein A
MGVSTFTPRSKCYLTTPVDEQEPKEAMTKIRRIVCPTDFSPTARIAIDYAAEMARSLGAEMVLLHVVPELSYPTRSFGMANAFPHLREELHKRASEELEAERARLDPATKVTTELRDGVSHEQVLECAHAQKADLIVMGTHGHTGLTHLVLGSTAERIVRMADCPVMTVRTPK